MSDAAFDSFPSPNPGQNTSRLYNEMLNGPATLLNGYTSKWNETVVSNR